MKETVRPAFIASEIVETVAFNQEYKKALRHQNKTFNQNGKHLPPFCLKQAEVFLDC